MEDLVRQFGLDWKLLLAQAVNFFVLLAVLRYFAYGPILKVLRERREKIAEGVKAAEESEKIRESAKAEKEAVLLEAEERAVAVVSAAEDKAGEQAKNIVDAAHQKSEQVILAGQRKLEEEHAKLAEEVRHGAEGLVQDALKVVIGKMDPDEKDRALIAAAVKELKGRAHV